MYFINCFITVLLPSLVIIFIPCEFKVIYSQILNTMINQKILLPEKSVNVNYIENTYGVERPGGRKHEGLDIFAPRFTPVVSVCDGHILKTGRDILGGNVVKILGRDKRIYYFAHLTKYLDFGRGQKIKQGQTIGFVGNTGNAISTPPHLHFEIMEIEWLLPLVTKNINPYFELANKSSADCNI